MTERAKTRLAVLSAIQQYGPLSRAGLKHCVAPSYTEAQIDVSLRELFVLGHGANETAVVV